jgi:DUF438 domain-containing protein
MSEYFGDGSSREDLKKLIKDLHAGLSLEAARDRFGKMIKGVDAAEIAALEQSLIDEGFPVEEIQRLCDVHAAVFEKALLKSPSPEGKAGKRAAKLARMPGHPIYTFKAENAEAAGIIRKGGNILKALSRGDPSSLGGAASLIEALSAYEFHLQRKENQLFPVLEAKGFSGPSKVMWAKDDEIREDIKAVRAALGRGAGDRAAAALGKLTKDIKSMIFKEEKILLPAALKKLSEEDWARVRSGEEEIGYAWVKPGAVYDPMLAFRSARAVSGGASPLPAGASSPGSGTIDLSVGKLSAEQIDLMLKAIPMDVTFVDENDKVRYYSGSAHRVFPRSPAIIGRDVRDCHPAKSVHVVEKIVEAFKKKERDNAEFWIEMDGRFIHIRYFPVYDASGAYKGTIEASQDCTDIRALSGSRRLLDWN